MSKTSTAAPTPPKQKAPKAPILSWEYFIYDQVKIGAALPALIIWRPRWYYESEKAKKRIRGAALLIANHSTFLDPIYIMLAVWYRRHHMLAAKEVMGTGIREWFFRHVLCINVDRDNFNLAKMREVVGHLKKGEMVTMFPDGHIAREESNDYKQGVIMIAMQANVPIVPVYIATRQHFWQRIGFSVGEPVTIEELTGSKMPSLPQIAEAAKKLHEKELQLKQKYEDYLKNHTGKKGEKHE